VARDPARDVRLAGGGLLVGLAVAGFATWAAAHTGSFPVAGAALHLLVGVGVWLGVLLTAQREVRAQEEALESQRLAALAEEGRRALFSGESALNEAAVRLARFRRAAHPAVALGLATLALAGAAWLWTRFPLETVKPSLPVAAVFGVLAFGLLLLGRYGFALADEGGVLAATGGRRALSSALVCLLACLATAAHDKGLEQADYLGYVFLAIEVLLALEAALLVLLEVYRPRRPGEVPRPPFDSRLLGLLSSPADLARSIARAVDYQFGFSISQTWFYRFLAGWVVPLAAFSVATFWLLSTLVIVEPHEVVLVRRFGSLQGAALEPGLHFKLPWPLDRTQEIAAGRLHGISTGAHEAGDSEEGEEGEEGHHHDGAILWTVSAWKAEDAAKAEADHLVLIARQSTRKDETPVNLVSAAASVHYRVADPLTFAERARDPQAVLKVLAQRELCFLFGGEDLDRLLRERPRHASALRDRLAKAVGPEGLDLGVKVESALLTDLHPPIVVGEAFEESTAAIERAQAEVLRARVRRVQLEERSRTEANWIRAKALLDAAERVALAEADAGRFGAIRALSAAAPELFRLTRLLEELAEGARGKRKVILGNPSAVTQLDLQEKISSEELGLGQSLQTGPQKKDQDE
jgi:membrane protease subunit HflK